MVSRKSQKSNASLIREFARYYQPHLRVFALDLFCALMIALIDVLFPVVTRRMLYVYIPEGAARTLVLVSFVIAAPLAFIIGNMWLNNFAEHRSMDWWVFPLTLLVVGGLTIGTIILQCWRTARENPTDSIKTE